MALSSKLTTVSPKQAKTWLEDPRNEVNPRGRTNSLRVDVYAQQILKGEWQETGEAIQFDTDDALKNGFHRLKAIVKADRAVRILIVRGVSANAVKVMDSGLARSVGDNLASHINTPTRASQLAAATKTVLAWRAGVVHSPSSTSREITRSAVIEFALENEKTFMDAINKGENIYRGIGGNFTSWIAAFFEMMQPEFDPNDVEAFYDAIRNGVGLETGDARLATRNWFISWAAHRRLKESLFITPALHIITRGWNFWMNGVERERIMLPQKPIIVATLLTESGRVSEELTLKAKQIEGYKSRKNAALSLISVEDVAESNTKKQSAS